MVVIQKPQSQSGIDMSGAVARDTSKNFDLFGTDAGKGSGVVRQTLTASLADPTAEAVVIDMEDADTLFLLVDYDKQGGSDLQIQVTSGMENALADINARETIEDTTETGFVKELDIDHKRETTGVYPVIVRKLLRFVRIRVKSGGAPTTDEVAIRFNAARIEGK